MSDGDEAGDGDASPGDAHPDATRPSVVRRGRAWALPELAHSVHVEVDGLRPDREWFYRFRYRHDLSPVGRTRTAPRPGSSFPWVVTWDDHEVQNDYANTQSQYEGDISALRAAAYQAWYEFFDGDRRGYIRCQVGRSQLRADLQVVTTVSRPDAPESTFASFVVEHGRPGAHRLA